MVEAASSRYVWLCALRLSSVGPHTPFRRDQPLHCREAHVMEVSDAGLVSSDVNLWIESIKSQ
jgi:hypothetical protein